MADMFEKRAEILSALYSARSEDHHLLATVANETMAWAHDGASRMQTEEQRLAYWYLRFVTSTVAAQAAASTRNFSDAFNWLMAGLCTDMVTVPQQLMQTCEPRIELLRRFIDSFSAVEVGEDVASWGATALYTSRASGAFHEWMHELIPLFHALTGLPESEVAAQLGVELAEWLIDHLPDHDLLAPLCRRLPEIHSHLAPDSATAELLALGLQGRIGVLAAVEREHYARELRRHPSAQVRFQVAAEDVLRALPNALDELVIEIEGLHRELHAMDPRSKERTAGVLFRVIHPLLVRFGEEGRHSELLTLLSSWRHGRAIRDVNKNIAVWLPNTTIGHIIVGPNGSRVHPRNTDLGSLIRVINEFRSTRVAWRKTLEPIEIPAVSPARAELVTGAAATEYEQMIRALVEEAALSQHLRCVEAFAVSPFEAHPIQPLLSSLGGPVRPWSASFSVPGPDRDLRRLAIVATDRTAEGLEVQWLCRVAGRHGLRLDVISPEGLSADTMRQIYEDPEFDVMWVAGHGQFDGDHPAESALPFESGGLVRFDDIHNWQVPSQGRRLLVMNVCHGGMVPFMEGNGELGTSARLSCAAQCVVSHQWNVDWRLAAMFGCILLGELLRGGGFLKAFEATLRSIRGGSPSMREALGALELHEAVDHLDKLGLSLDGIQHWGSAAFYE